MSYTRTELIIDHIEPNSVHEYTGNLHVKGNIGAGASVTVKFGDLIVDGSIENNVTIGMPDNSHSSCAANRNYYVNGKERTWGHGLVRMNVNGDVGENVKVEAMHTTFNVLGKLGKGCALETYFGHINVTIVGDDCTLKTADGHINVNRAGDHVKFLIGEQGNVNVLDVVGPYVDIKINAGIVNLQTIAQGAKITVFESASQQNIRVYHDDYLAYETQPKIANTSHSFYRSEASKKQQTAQKPHAAKQAAPLRPSVIISPHVEMPAPNIMTFSPPGCGSL